MLQKVPYFSQILTPDDWGAVLGCNRACREVVHNFATTIFLDKSEQVEEVMHCQWPRLVLIVLCKPPVDFISRWHWLRDDMFHLVATVALSDKTLSALALVVISKSRCQILTQDCVERCIADACLYLWNEVWQQIDSLTVRYVTRSRFIQAEVLAQLAAISWPNLTELDLGFLNLESAAISHLVKGSWPLLKVLDLQGNKLDTAAAEMLCTGNWPELWLRDLCDSQLDDAATGYLAKGQWSKLEVLLLHGNAISASGVGRLMQSNLFKLRRFSLSTSGASVATCKLLQLQAESWQDKRFVESFEFEEQAFVLPRTLDSNHLSCWPSLARVHFVPLLSISVLVQLPVWLVALPVYLGLRLVFRLPKCDRNSVFVANLVLCRAVYPYVG